MAFQRAFLDFQKGIRVGHLEPHERITQILKNRLEATTGEIFNIDRFGRGVYWQWICFCPRRNRSLKPHSGTRNFCSAKFFISIETDTRLFKAGTQIERGFLSPPPQWESARLAEDWDWHRLLESLGEVGFYKKLEWLVKEEDFHVRTGSWHTCKIFHAGNFPPVEGLLKALREVPPDEWNALQVYFPMPEAEVEASAGDDLVDAMLAVFQEVAPIMNGAMQIQLEF